MNETVIVANSFETKTAPAMGKFERYLTLWVALCFIAGIALGQVIPAVFRAIGAATVQFNSYAAGLIVLATAPCTARVLV